MEIGLPYKDYDHAAKLARGFAFTIDSEARWYCHDPAMSTGPIRRVALAGLFAGAGRGYMAGKGLSLDDKGRYWLTSPHETYAIEVEDVPFLITNCRDDGGTLVLSTNFAEEVALGEKSFMTRPNGPFPDIPYIEVRQSLLARLGRTIFYELAARATLRDETLFVASGGREHCLGQVV